jgi:tetratricopeptide (TPR) repeat protein
VLRFCVGCTLYQSTNACTAALHFYLKALAIREQTVPSKHPDLATTYSSVGDIHRIMGQHDTALSLHRQALDIQENVTCNGLDTATTYVNMGETLRELLDYPYALVCYKKALELREKLLPNNHLQLAVTHHNLAQAYLAAQEPQSAMEHIELALEIGQQKLPEHHPHLLAYEKTLENIREKL